MTSSNGNIFRVTGHVCGEITAQRPVTRSFDVFFDLRLNKCLSKQSWVWWFETLSCPLWRHCNDGLLFRCHFLKGREWWINTLGPIYKMCSHDPINTLRPRQNERHFADDISSAFSWMKMFEFRLKFHLSLFLRVQLTIIHHWFR